MKIINIKDIQKMNIKKYLQDTRFKDQIFKSLNQEINKFLDEGYEYERVLGEDYVTIFNFLAELADSVDSRLGNELLSRYEMKEEGQ